MNNAEITTIAEESTRGVFFTVAELAALVGALDEYRAVCGLVFAGAYASAFLSAKAKLENAAPRAPRVSELDYECNCTTPVCECDGASD